LQSRKANILVSTPAKYIKQRDFADSGKCYIADEGYRGELGADCCLDVFFYADIQTILFNGLRLVGAVRGRINVRS